jgi:hypothetical protein
MAGSHGYSPYSALLFSRWGIFNVVSLVLAYDHGVSIPL